MRPSPFRRLLTWLMWGVRPFTAIMRAKSYYWMSSAKSSFTICLSVLNTSLHKTTWPILLSKNDYFIRQLRKELEHDVYPMVADELIQSHPNIPHSYLKHLVITNFIETLTWWLKKGKSYSEQEVVQFYLEILNVASN